MFDFALFNGPLIHHLQNVCSALPTQSQKNAKTQNQITLIPRSATERDLESPVSSLGAICLTCICGVFMKKI
jgi:hypothetical protein